jgi:K+-sensing histidine kinase KdpD
MARLCYHGYVQQRQAVARRYLVILGGVAAPLVLTAVLVPFRHSFPNTDAALALILVVVAVAAFGSRTAGVLAAVSAAVWFDFFLTRPYERFSITSRTDIETTVLILVIGLAVTELAVWGRRQHLTATRRAGYLQGINAAAEAVAVGSSASALIDDVSGQLVRLLSVRSCRFERGVAGLGRPARLRHDGHVVSPDERRELEVSRDGMPTTTELLVENHGVLQGRFLLTADLGARPSLEQLLVAVAFADQVGAALAASAPVS